MDARSPLSEAQKEAIVRAEYFPAAHRIGLVTSLLHVVIFFLPPLYLMAFHGVSADWGKILQGAAATWSTSMPLWFIEPVTYFLVLGVCGTYISFLAGNISNFRLPVSAVAQQVAQVEEGSTEGEIVSTLAIASTQVMITLSALAGAIFVSAIVGRAAGDAWWRRSTGCCPRSGAPSSCSSACATGATRWWRWSPPSSWSSTPGCRRGATR